MRKTMKSWVAMTLVAVAVIVGVPLVAHAVDRQQATSPSDSRHMPPAPSGGGQTHVAEAFLKGENLKRCQAHEQAITTILSRVAERGRKNLKLIDTIAQRVEAFYAKKGLTVADYSQLTDDVTAKRTTANNAVTAVLADSQQFQCDGSSDPRAFVRLFKVKMQEQNSALHAFRTAVKNLIVGVKSAAQKGTE